MASTISVSHPHPSFSLPPISSYIAAIPTSDFVIVADPSDQKSLKIHVKKISNDLSPVKEVGDSSIAPSINGSEPCYVSNTSKQKSLKIRIKKISNDPSPAKERGDSTYKVESLPRIKTQPTQVPTDQPVINVTVHVPAAAKKNQKKRRFSVTLSRKEIEADIAEIEALAGLKRMRIPKKRDQHCWNVDQRQLDRLFPGLGYC